MPTTANRSLSCRLSTAPILCLASHEALLDAHPGLLRSRPVPGNFCTGYPVVFEGAEFPTTDLPDIATRSLDPGMRLAITQCPTPGDAKRMGWTIPLRDHWEQLRLVFMTARHEAKFSQSRTAAETARDKGRSP